MRFPSLLLTLTGAAVLTGCSSVISLNPFVTDRQATMDPALLGTWKPEQRTGARPSISVIGLSGDFGDDDLYIIRGSGSAYDITYTDGKFITQKFEARLIRVGTAELLDLVPANDDGFQIPAHLLVRVWPKDSKLRWVFLDSDWLKQQAAQLLATQPSDDRTLITASSDALGDFVLKYGSDPRAFNQSADQQNVLEKVP
jgi:hypothetical protein